MAAFEEYAHFYDTLYQDKNYAAECDFIERQCAQRSAKPVRTVLDLGCGTGRHAIELARRGYHVTGVDRSRHMLSQARKSAPAQAALEFIQGDLTSVQLNRTFDAVICMFAVLSYVHDNENLIKAFSTVRDHLTPGGVFVCDFWYGPGVLHDPPRDRAKSFKTGATEIVRYAQGTLHENDNLADVAYRVLQITDGQLQRDVRETHTMRYFFAPELSLIAGLAGMRLDFLCNFLDEKSPASTRSWCASAIFKRK